jgi:DtxR family Mn-dependent transcriptional regulator
MITMEEYGLHPPIEEYLEAIHCLAEENKAVIQARIAERLGRSAPSVSEMLDRMELEGYIARDGRTIVLTSQGRRRAERVVRKHRLAECLLVDIIGIAWHKAHLEAGKWEHVISDEVEERLVVLLGNPTTCPHGNPIPGCPSPTTTPEDQMRLVDTHPGDAVQLKRITEEGELDQASLAFLDRYGLTPGRVAFVTDVYPSGNMLIEYDSVSVELPAHICEQIYVTMHKQSRAEVG